MSANVMDDRDMRITIIRKSEMKPIDPELNENQKHSVEMIKSKYGRFHKPSQKIDNASAINTLLRKKNREKRFREKHIKKNLPKSLKAHTLMSVSQTVMARYQDCPDILQKRLPFGVEHGNRAGSNT